MNFADLTDTNYRFTCAFAGDACDFWDYDFSVERWDDKYSRNLSKDEVVQLRDNCKRILEAIDELQGV